MEEEDDLVRQGVEQGHATGPAAFQGDYVAGTGTMPRIEVAQGIRAPGAIRRQQGQQSAFLVRLVNLVHVPCLPLRVH